MRCRCNDKSSLQDIRRPREFAASAVSGSNWPLGGNVFHWLDADGIKISDVPFYNGIVRHGPSPNSYTLAIECLWLFGTSQGKFVNTLSQVNDFIRPRRRSPLFALRLSC